MCNTDQINGKVDLIGINEWKQHFCWKKSRAAEWWVWLDFVVVLIDFVLMESTFGGAGRGVMVYALVGGIIIYWYLYPMLAAQIHFGQETLFVCLHWNLFLFRIQHVHLIKNKWCLITLAKIWIYQTQTECLPWTDI